MIIFPFNTILLKTAAKSDKLASRKKQSPLIAPKKARKSANRTLLPNDSGRIRDLIEKRFAKKYPYTTSKN